MLERIGRLCVGLGVMWVLIIVGLWLMVGLDRPDEWTPYLDRAMSSDLRQPFVSEVLAQGSLAAAYGAVVGIALLGLIGRGGGEEA